MSLPALGTLLVAALPLLAGCLDGGQHGTVADALPPADAVPLADTATAPSDTLSMPTETTRVPTCRPAGLRVVASGVVDEAPSPWQLAVADADTIYASGADFYRPPDPGLYRFVPSTGAVTQPSPAGTFEVLRDAVGDAVLVSRGGDDVQTLALVYRDGAGEVVLSDVDGGEQVWSGSPYAADYPRMVGPRRAAWRGCLAARGWACQQAAVRGWQGGAVRTLWATPLGDTTPTPAAPDVDERGIVWAEPAIGDAPARIGLWDAGTEPRYLRTWDANVTRLARTGGDVLVVDPRGVWLLDERGEAAPKLLTAGQCGPLTVAQGSAAWLCADPPTDPSEAPWTPFPGAQGTLWSFVARNVTAVPTEGELVVLPRLDHGVLTWLTYPRASDGCFDLGPGQVWAAVPGAPGGPVSLGEIGIGCYCCAMIWPEIQLDLADGLIAWNYANFAGRPVDGREFGRLGWARVEVEQVCE